MWDNIETQTGFLFFANLPSLDRFFNVQKTYFVVETLPSVFLLETVAKFSQGILNHLSNLSKLFFAMSVFL